MEEELSTNPLHGRVRRLWAWALATFGEDNVVPFVWGVFFLLVYLGVAWLFGSDITLSGRDYVREMYQPDLLLPY